MSEARDSFSAHRLPRGRHGLAPEQVAESQRWRLLAAAADVLLARGYGGVTSREISSRAGVSSATLYEHFENADACLVAAHAMTVDSLWELLGAACTGPGTWLERLRAALDAATSFLVSEPSFARLLCADLAVGIPAVALARERFGERLAGLLCSGRCLRLRTADRLPPRLECLLADATLALFNDRIVAAEPGTLAALAPELSEILAAPYLAA